MMVADEGDFLLLDSVRLSRLSCSWFFSKRANFRIQAAILGSILATMLLCMDYLIPGVKQEATFSHAIIEAANLSSSV
jgi:hypothetical protein